MEKLKLVFKVIKIVVKLTPTKVDDEWLEKIKKIIEDYLEAK
jgi:hypothetical protein